MLVIVLVTVVIASVVVVLATAWYIGPQFAVTKKNFAPYSTPVSSNGANPSSITVVDTYGGVILAPWSQSYVTINGTVTARGISSSPDSVTFIESNTSGDIVFQAVFPSGSSFFTTSYTADIYVYFPATYTFNVVQATTVNGNVQVSNIITSSLALTDTNGQITATGVVATGVILVDTNGGIDVSCALCQGVTATTQNGSLNVNLTTLFLTGSYTLTTTNGSINLKTPANGNYQITVNTTNGSVSSTGLAVTLVNHITATIGSGNGIIIATTTNGSISVTGV